MTAAMILALPAVGSASIVREKSPTYAGLVAALPSGGGQRSVDASLVVPKLQCTTGPAKATFWAGWGDPVGGGAAVRTGLEASCHGPNASYALVMQWDDPAVQSPVTTVDLGTVEPGDDVELGVTRTPGHGGWRGMAFLSGCDNAGCWARGVQRPIRRPADSTAKPARAAACVVQAPGRRDGTATLADFGSVRWKSCRADVGSDHYLLAGDRGSRHFDVTRVKMVDSHDVTRAAVTDLGRRAFSITWKHG